MARNDHNWLTPKSQKLWNELLVMREELEADRQQARRQDKFNKAIKQATTPNQEPSR